MSKETIIAQLDADMDGGEYIKTIEQIRDKHVETVEHIMKLGGSELEDNERNNIYTAYNTLIESFHQLSLAERVYDGLKRNSITDAEIEHYLVMVKDPVFVKVNAAVNRLSREISDSVGQDLEDIYDHLDGAKSAKH